MNEILKNKALRRNFFGLTIVVIICLMAVWTIFHNSGINEETIKISKTIIERLATGIFITVIIGVYIFFMVPKYDPKDGAEFLLSNQVSDYFKSIINEKPTEWYYKGGIGTYLRKTVLPSLLNYTETNKVPVFIQAQIPNPKNDKLCSLQAGFRKNHKDKKDWSSSDIKLNLYATIVICSIYESKNDYININLFLTEFYSTTKIDITSSSGILTKDDNSYGIKFKKGSSHYDSWRGELTITEKQGNKVQLINDVSKKLNSNYIIGNVSGTEIKNILAELGFTEKLTRSDFNKIAELVNEQQNN